MQKLRHTSKRLNLRLLCSGLLLVLFVCCSSMALAASQVDISQPEETISVPLNDWNQLKSSLQKADDSINNSKQSLNEVDALTMRQAEELTALKNINEKRGQELTALKAINEQQKNELSQASNLLTEQDERLSQASNSLIELKEEIKRNKATEQRLKRQRDTWAAGGVIGFLIGAAGAIR